MLELCQQQKINVVVIFFSFICQKVSINWINWILLTHGTTKSCFTNYLVTCKATARNKVLNFFIELTYLIMTKYVLDKYCYRVFTLRWKNSV